MKFRLALCGAALIVATAALTTQVVSQDHPKGDHPRGDHPKKDHPSQQPPANSPEEEMMAKWAEFMTPGENHQRLAFKVGKWNGEVKHWMAPGAEPETAPATAEYEWIMDGRYLHGKVASEFDGMPFHGQAWEGYDNLKKKFGWVWIDNMGTGFMHAEGTYDDASKTFKYSYEHPDLMAGKYSKGRSVDRVIDNDHFVSEMYGPGPDGKEFKMMEITYTRAS